MNDYLLLMHNDLPIGDAAPNGDAWGKYMNTLRQAGVFEGGSAIGGGICLKKSGVASQIASHLTGYLRIQASSRRARSSLATRTMKPAVPSKRASCPAINCALPWQRHNRTRWTPSAINYSGNQCLPSTPVPRIYARPCGGISGINELNSRVGMRAPPRNCSTTSSARSSSTPSDRKL